MQNSLSRFETDLLNKFIHTHTFDELGDLQSAMNESMNEQRTRMIGEGETNENDFNSFTAHSIAHISDFLVGNEFFHAREGGIYFLTEKGKHLKVQGSLHNYTEWEKSKNMELVDDMHSIQLKGYVNREQPSHVELMPPPIDNEQKRNWAYYILIIIVLIVLYLVGKNHKFN